MKLRPLGKRQMAILKYMSRNYGITTAMAYRIGKSRYPLHSLAGNKLIWLLNETHRTRRWHLTVAGDFALEMGYWVDKG